LRGNHEPNYGHKKACNSACNISARLPGKAAGQGCRARLPGKAAGQGCQARLPGKSAGQGCRPRLHAMVEYAKSMVKLDNNAVFRKKKNNKAKLRPSLYLRTNAGKN
jgi:hypothetical protein